MELTREKLEALLREAELAHAQFEKETGERDEGWPAWYAEFILRKLEEE